MFGIGIWCVWKRMVEQGYEVSSWCLGRCLRSKTVQIDQNAQKHEFTNNFINLGSSVEYSQYVNCLNNVQVELYKIDTMSHVWPKKDRFGISASEVIFNFFNTYDANGKLN